MAPFHFTAAAAAAALPAQTEAQLRFVTLLQRGTLSVELYAPQGEDRQTPHDQDELYVVISGHGEFLNSEERHPFQAGDLLFVPAGVEHRFLSFSDDFQTWVIFYGPRGGELPAERQPSDAPAHA
jgi:mannose-6-phosphate isomerase-like protein (cupin superfamily)